MGHRHRQLRVCKNVLRNGLPPHGTARRNVATIQLPEDDPLGWGPIDQERLMEFDEYVVPVEWDGTNALMKVYIFKVSFSTTKAAKSIVVVMSL